MKKKHKPEATGDREARVSIPTLKSGFKYAYLAALFVLLSGFFHPLITDTSFDVVLIGSLVLAVGLAGGILLHRATTSDSYRTICMGVGFGLVALSLYAIFLITGRA